MLQRTGASRCDHRHGNSSRDRRVEREIVALLSAVTIHACEENFTRSERYSLLCPPYNIFARQCTPAVNKYLVPARHRGIGASIDGQHDTLRSELFRPGPQEVRLLYRRCIQRNLVAPAPRVARMSSTPRIPPPTVTRMTTCSPVRRATPG